MENFFHILCKLSSVLDASYLTFSGVILNVLPGWFSQGLARPESPPYTHKEVPDEPLKATEGEWPPSGD